MAKNSTYTEKPMSKPSGCNIKGTGLPKGGRPAGSKRK